MKYLKDFCAFISWRTNPHSILWQAGFLFTLAMCFHTHYAILQIKLHNDWVYLWIEIGAMILLAIALSPMYWYYKRIK